MDRLVSRGISFTQTHVMGGFNGAISQPSRAMLLTGRGLMDIHRNGGVIPENERTFPELFRENGYTTFATGKWHSDNASFTRSFSVECILTGNTMNWDIGALPASVRSGREVQ